jgi:hypothetical protein
VSYEEFGYDGFFDRRCGKASHTAMRLSAISFQLKPKQKLLAT